jgi:DNA-3-methyladenine glycosylase II
MPFYAQHIRTAQTHLKKVDPKLRDIIRDVGPFTLKAQKHHFHVLVKSIVSQQISTAAAATILARLIEKLGANPLQVGAFQGMDPVSLREVGISQQKAMYILDLVQKVETGAIDLERIRKLGDDQVLELLTQVKGIGTWTAQMFLMFSLGRLDVLPTGDMGIKSAIQRHYNFADLPTPHEIETVAAPWRPYATVASWYLWRSLELNDNPS